MSITRTSNILIISAPLFVDLHTASRIRAIARRRIAGHVETIFTPYYDELGADAPPVARGQEFLDAFTAALKVSPSN